MIHIYRLVVKNLNQDKLLVAGTDWFVLDSRGSKGAINARVSICDTIRGLCLSSKLPEGPTIRRNLGKEKKKQEKMEFTLNSVFFCRC